MKPSILIVEDDEDTRSWLCTLLAGHGFAPIGAATGGSARALLRAGPDLMLLDLMLPDDEGESIVRYVRDRGLPTRVVALTASDRGSPRVASLTRAHPEVAVLFKPIELADLLRSLGPA